MIRTPLEVQRDILAGYEAGEPSTSLARLYRKTPGAILDIVRRQGGTVRTLSDAKRVYPLREDAFALPLSPEASYWFGFLLADGCVTRRRTGQATLQLGLAEKDAAHVEAFARFLGTAQPKFRAEGRGYAGASALVGLHVTSHRLCDALGALGLVPRKSMRERMPEQLHSSRDAWRGMVDGDGWIAAGSFALGLTGSRTVCEQLSASLSGVAGVHASITPNRTIWKAMWTGNASRKVIEHLYEGACVSLARKQERADTAIAVRKRWGDKRPNPGCKATRFGCAVVGCEGTHRRDGFCALHCWKPPAGTQRLFPWGSPAA